MLGRLCFPLIPGLLLLPGCSDNPAAERAEQTQDVEPMPAPEPVVPPSQTGDAATEPPASPALPPSVVPSYGTSHTTAPDQFAFQTAEAALAEDLDFQTAETLDGVTHGLIGDGITDNTAVFRKLLAGGNRTILVPPGEYVTTKLDFESNTVLILQPGVTVRDAGRLGAIERLFTIRFVQNVRITGFGARVIASRSNYTSGEQRHGVMISGSRRVVVEGLESSGHGGDGFYIGGPMENPSTDVLLRGCKADNNRRQGLSITSGRRVRVVDCEFRSTNGTAPQFGIDIEPNYPLDALDDVIFVRPQTASNHGGGIMIHLNALDTTSPPVHVMILEHYSANETPSLRTDVPDGVLANLVYSGM